jgi:hypothetical protein
VCGAVGYTVSRPPLTRLCENSRNTPNFSWGFFNFGLCRSARPLPRLLLFSPRVAREERYKNKEGPAAST